jgi:hypothetical protein
MSFQEVVVCGRAVGDQRLPGAGGTVAKPMVVFARHADAGLHTAGKQRRLLGWRHGAVLGCLLLLLVLVLLVSTLLGGTVV